MRLPVIRGRIERRLLINYRAQPDVVQRLLPPPFRPQLVGGHAIVGLCLIRLRDVRPVGLPAWTGIESESAAHRIAVEWREAGELRNGVYILRRDTNSGLNALAGGRIFPGIHHYSSFTVRETGERMQVSFKSSEGNANASIIAHVSRNWPTDSVFSSTEEASAFFERAPIGYSPGRTPGQLQGLNLSCDTWRAEALDIQEVNSSFFDEEARFPPRTIALDSGLIMRDIEHEWHTCADMCVADEENQAATDASSSTHALTTS
jgi:hypothetical protein